MTMKFSGKIGIPSQLGLLKPAVLSNLREGDPPSKDCGEVKSFSQKDLGWADFGSPDKFIDVNLDEVRKNEWEKKNFLKTQHEQWLMVAHSFHAQHP